MAITLTDEMMEILQGLEKGEAKMFLRGIQLAQKMGNGEAGPGPAPTIPPTIPPPSITPKAGAVVRDRQPSVGYRRNRGARAEVLRALFTGPASYVQLQEVLRYDRELVVKTLAMLTKEGHVSMLLSAGRIELWQLTPQGRHLAAYYVANPGLKVLNSQHKAKLAKDNKPNGG